MPSVLIVTDADFVSDEVEAALVGSGNAVHRVRAGVDVVPAVRELEPDLVVLDLQIGNMGGMAVCMELRLEAAAGRAPTTRILMLLDRRADVFLARRSGADGWLVKPIDAFRIRRAATTILSGGRYHDGAPDPQAEGDAALVREADSA